MHYVVKDQIELNLCRLALVFDKFNNYHIAGPQTFNRVYNM